MSALTRARRPPPSRRCTAALLTVAVAALGAERGDRGPQAGGRDDHRPLRRRRRPHRPGPGVLLVHATRSRTPPSGRCSSYGRTASTRSRISPSAMPTYSNGGKTVTVHIRPGVRFSPPVNREVTSADVKYGIERAFASSVANGYAGAYFGDVVGAPAKATKGVPNIKGILTPSKDTIVFKLKQPDGVFTGSLGLPVTAPVPREYAKQFDDQTTSTYGMHQVATGPYMIKNDSSGNINGVGYKPGQLIDLVRNPNWDAKTSWRPAHASEVAVQGGLPGSDRDDADDPLRGRPTSTATRRRRRPSSSRSSPTRRQRKQLDFTPTGGSRYVALNTSEAAVRQPRRPPGGGIRPRPQRDAPDARRRDRRPDRDALHRPELQRARASPRRAASSSTRSRAPASGETSRRRRR